ncbi:hypothetical protein EKL97_01180 [Flavobacterium sp. LS1P28]|uniref:hypothetical protein n=1 Tax=Flavobacterium sp. LS1P28 TaxID=2497752 RepID=UPI000F83449B|nr:hypothetical protein [Flavobacterium sp. LS1P28]RTY85254.1 hypothetical protein EKL97_01180 [Flavobacterium sp. LS1P28]
MKLTTEQIEYVSNYVRSFDIKWCELQVELTDHMVTSMEEIWEKDPELTFHQVKQYAEDRFGRNGFKVIEEDRTQILRKEFRKAQWNMITEYLRFPKIILGILLALLIFKATFYFDEPIKFVKNSFVLLAILFIPAFYSFYANRKIKGKRFLELNISHSTFTGIFVFMYWIVFLLNTFKESIQRYPIIMLPFCCAWVMGILFIITGIHLQRKTIVNVKKQYQLN